MFWCFFTKTIKNRLNFFYMPKSWTDSKKSWQSFLTIFHVQGVGAMIRFHENKKCATNTRTFIMGSFENRDTPKSSILIGFSIINHPFWGIPIFGNIHMHGTLCYPRSIRSPMETPPEVWFLHHPVGSLRITAWAPWGLRLGYDGRNGDFRRHEWLIIIFSVIDIAVIIYIIR